MRPLVRTFFAMLLAAAATVPAYPQIVAPGNNAQVWSEYTNDRFGVQSDIPTVGFFPQDNTDNADGITLLDASGDIEIRVFGNYWNTLSDSFAQYRAERRQGLEQLGADITYEPGGDNWFVFSGFIEDSIFYFKATTRAGCNAAGHIYFVFPEDARDAMSPVIERMEDSLRLSSSSECP